ncbi:VacJ family lipoprotein [Curvibacter sp. HBC61]|uniref:VacJ family lipoprotein n=1 Tax=Curvibacter cyanobacteriorum TaxID=3026422 RepID=A0ABT5MZF2_9BURK|nr:VacJ family lipoprotein [Curvibacter sp. HBC61]MDD0839188.1 VacJ family lipoprotein [Curvibacter sp. HBC61]
MHIQINTPSQRRPGAWWRWALLTLALALLSGCASGPGKNPRDPLEPFNRDMSRFNEAVDSAVLKPVATAYREVTPSLVRTGVNNFFSNLGEVWSFVNNVLQLNVKASADTALRFGFNTIFGLGGVLDLASEMQIEQHKQDFGQTLARYGVPTGPYIVLPILGPSTLRDTVAFPLIMKGDVVTRIDHVPTRNSLFAARLVSVRSNLLGASRVLDEAALDKYSFTRDVYLQLRDNEQRNGKASVEDDDGALPPEPLP